MGSDIVNRAVLQAFEKYQKERVAFVTAVAEMANRPQVAPLARLLCKFFSTHRNVARRVDPLFHAVRKYSHVVKV